MAAYESCETWFGVHFMLSAMLDANFDGGLPLTHREGISMGYTTDHHKNKSSELLMLSM